MMSQLEIVRNAWRHSLFLGVGILILAAAPGGAKAAGAATHDDATDTYTWSAELVGFDATAKTITVKARVVSHADIDDLADFAAGDRVMLTWSGVFSAAGIRSLMRGSETESGRFTMPVEFVSADPDGRYLTFEVPIPSADVGKIKPLTPGTWVTATSPHNVSDTMEAVSEIRPYNDVS